MVDKSAGTVSAACSGDVSVFETYLKQAGQAFLLTGEQNAERRQIRFTGMFEGQQVVWDCEFVTLAFEFRRISGRPYDRAVQSLRCFIEIGDPVVQGVPLRVGLDLPRIGSAEIKKMIIMVRNYKRLHRGRYEFGDEYRP